MDKPNKRYRQAFQMRADGATYQAIGDALGVTRSRARQIVISYKRWLRSDKSPKPDSVATLDITTWTRNSLVFVGYRQLSDLEKVPAKDLLDIPNFGPKALQDLRQALAKSGRDHFRCMEDESTSKEPLPFNSKRATTYANYLRKWGYEVIPPPE